MILFFKLNIDKRVKRLIRGRVVYFVLFLGRLLLLAAADPFGTFLKFTACFI